MGTQTKDVVDTRWVMPWEEVGGKQAVKANLVAEGYQGPDLRGGHVYTAGRVSGRSPHLQLMSLRGLGAWHILRVDFENALLRSDGFDREAYVRAPCGGTSEDNRRVWKLKAPAYALKDAPCGISSVLAKVINELRGVAVQNGLRT